MKRIIVSAFVGIVMFGGAAAWADSPSGSSVDRQYDEELGYERFVWNCGDSSQVSTGGHHVYAGTNGVEYCSDSPGWPVARAWVSSDGTVHRDDNGFIAGGYKEEEYQAGRHTSYQSYGYGDYSTTETTYGADTDNAEVRYESHSESWDGYGYSTQDTVVAYSVEDGPYIERSCWDYGYPC